MLNIKKEAKKLLKDNWSKLIFMFLIVFCAYSIILIAQSLVSLLIGVNNYVNIFISIINFILTILFVNPLIFGCYYFLYYTFNGATLPLSSIFYYFNSLDCYKKATKLSYLIAIKTSISYFMFSLPSLFTSIFFKNNLFLISISTALSLFGLVIMVINSLKLFAAPVLLVNDDSATPYEIIHFSKEISFENKSNIFKFVLSFIGWFYLSTFILPLFFVFPYYLGCVVLKSKSLIEEYNKKIEDFNKDYYLKLLNNSNERHFYEK